MCICSCIWYRNLLRLNTKTILDHFLSNASSFEKQLYCFEFLSSCVPYIKSKEKVLIDLWWCKKELCYYSLSLECLVSASFKIGICTNLWKFKLELWIKLSYISIYCTLLIIWEQKLPNSSLLCFTLVKIHHQKAWLPEWI